MPKFLATIGGRYSRKDKNSYWTAIRETIEETGIINPKENLKSLVKIAFGKDCDWFRVIV